MSDNKTGLVIRWQPSSSGGVFIVKWKMLGCGSLSEWEALDRYEQKKRIESAVETPIDI